MLNLEKELAELRRMTVNQLQQKWEEVFREPTSGRHKQWLIKRIAWRMQANEYGDLSERAKERAKAIANDADLRLSPPKSPVAKVQGTTVRSIPASFTDGSPLLSGMSIQRIYKGQEIRVVVRDQGFEYEGERFNSLTAVAKAVTGKHWNGFHFFGLRKKPEPAK